MVQGRDHEVEGGTASEEREEEEGKEGEIGSEQDGEGNYDKFSYLYWRDAVLEILLMMMVVRMNGNSSGSRADHDTIRGIRYIVTIPQAIQINLTHDRNHDQ
uniref:Uncharacterized protein n=1 Tax=Spongospora subterranea TaxID=70186 RepID=A0A0H5RTJ6_9EUKA|eukprot:CRZ12064.1 hypothetical protein [Spongospora subterranea]